MTPSNASGGPPASDPAAATGGGSAAAFGPCMWNDFFRSEEWMTERVNRLKEEVRMFEAGKAMSAADTLKLVDTLERLGIDDHFRKEIDVALARVHSDVDHGSSNDIHIVSLRFRLLRQHGLWVSAGKFF
nr:unnamed protein product [Digitaria exilis]